MAHGDSEHRGGHPSGVGCSPRQHASPDQQALDSARPFGTAYALDFALGLTTALLAEDRRDEARVLLLDTWQTTREIGTRGVEGDAAANRVVAERLFISEKTVSVYVTNILAKLGVANRAAAAVLARELAEPAI